MTDHQAALNYSSYLALDEVLGAHLLELVVRAEGSDRPVSDAMVIRR